MGSSSEGFSNELGSDLPAEDFDGAALRCDLLRVARPGRLLLRHEAPDCPTSDGPAAAKVNSSNYRATGIFYREIGSVAV